MARKDENLSPEEEQLRQLRESQKELKKERRSQKKEAKRRAKELEDQERELDEQVEGTNTSVVVVTIFIIVIWLGILCLLVKMDVGGFGSNVLAPVLEDVPVLNLLLPSDSETETTKDTSYGGYSSIKEAVEQINALEQQIEQLQTSNSSYAEQVEALKTEVERLQTFEDNQVEFQKIKEQFYEEVVYAENGPGAEAYKEYYESMDADIAAELYKQVVQETQISSEMKDYVATFSSMDASSAAAILSAMTDDLDLAAEILENMSSSNRASIMAEMDASIAARLAKIMNPSN